MPRAPRVFNVQLIGMGSTAVIIATHGCLFPLVQAGSGRP